MCVSELVVLPSKKFLAHHERAPNFTAAVYLDHVPTVVASVCYIEAAATMRRRRRRIEIESSSRLCSTNTTVSGSGHFVCTYSAHYAESEYRPRPLSSSSSSSSHNTVTQLLWPQLVSDRNRNSHFRPNIRPFFVLSAEIRQFTTLSAQN
jgi:hypothetical protein